MYLGERYLKITMDERVVKGWCKVVTWRVFRAARIMRARMPPKMPIKTVTLNGGDSSEGEH
jgi:hypothetical protein